MPFVNDSLKIYVSDGAIISVAAFSRRGVMLFSRAPLLIFKDFSSLSADEFDRLELELDTHRTLTEPSSQLKIYLTHDIPTFPGF